MENWDEDFSTLKAPPKTTRPLSSWKADIPIDSGDVTITKRRMPKHQPTASDAKPVPFVDLDEDEDDDFADDFEAAAKFRRASAQQAVYSEALDLSDSSSARSPERASSISSAMSQSSTATSWDANEELNDSDFDLGDAEVDLKRRLRNRQERAKAEAAQEQAKLSANYAKTVKKRRSFRPAVEFDEDLMDLGLDKLPAKMKSGTDTVNKNIKFGPAIQPGPQQPSKMLRGMRSIAQMPNQRSETPQKLRAAVSMLNLGSRTDLGNREPSNSRYDLATLRLKPQASQQFPQQSAFPLQPTFQQQQPAFQQPAFQQRPLTSYKDPNIGTRRHKPKRPNLIQYPSQVTSKQKYNGMVLNPATGMWEGNDIDDSRFDLELDAPAKPKLITKQSFREPDLASSTGMRFDNRTLSWVYANEEEYDDPFAGIEEDETATPFTGISSMSRPTLSLPSTPSVSANLTPRHHRKESTMSTASSFSTAGRASVARSEASGSEVFDISTRLASEWRHTDERFMRKFGKWIGGDEERADSLLSDQQFYDMVRNA